MIAPVNKTFNVDTDACDRLLRRLKPARQNDKVYKPVDPSDPSVIQLADDIKKNGLLDPIVITVDGYIISGHRRFVACKLAGLKYVPTRTVDITSDDPEFLRLLVSWNMQREKSSDERLREDIILVDPEYAYQALIDHRKQSSFIATDCIELKELRVRTPITKAKRQMVDAVIKVINERKEYWPLSVRAVHYALLNEAPLMHSSKPASTYKNTQKCYKNLVDLLTRLRLNGEVSFAAISDETRPVKTWNVHQSTGSYVRKELSDFLRGYWRNLQQSQPNHIEIMVEKNTVASIIETVAAQYCITMTSGRGYSSLPPRADMAKRFRLSGKEKLIIVVVSDFDPDGETIAESFARSMRDDFDIANTIGIKAALTYEQTQTMELPSSLEAKKKSSGYADFVRQYGKQVFELEAVPPATLQQLVTETIDSVLDVDAFNREVDAEKNDAAWLDQQRQRVRIALQDIDFSEEG